MNISAAPPSPPSPPRQPEPQVDWVIFGIGNRSRGDDAAGPLILDWLADQPPPPGGWLLLEVFQLQPEHVLDMALGRQVLFIDADLGLTAQEAWRVAPCAPDTRPRSFSHHLTPAQLLGAFSQICANPPPAAWVWHIRAEHLNLGHPPSLGLHHILNRLEHGRPDTSALHGQGLPQIFIWDFFTQKAQKNGDQIC